MESGSTRKPPIDDGRARELLRQGREQIESELADHERLHRGEAEGVREEVNAEDTGERIEEETIDDALAHSLRVKLQAIERAEKRLADGTYGFSVESGEPIPKERLEAIPWAERTKDEQQH